MIVPRHSYRTPAGRMSYKALAADLDRQHQAALRELESIPKPIRDLCKAVRRVFGKKGA